MYIFILGYVFCVYVKVVDVVGDWGSLGIVILNHVLVRNV